MAKQNVQVNVRQESSGSGVSVAVSWTSDGNPVRSQRVWLRQPEGQFTIDAKTVEEIRYAVELAVRRALAAEQLF
jgi:hypothetical protein